jgi:predicted flap endonuclease-1-like 5' DNA nuclease
MPTYKVSRPLLRHDGEEHQEGDTVEMTGQQAAPLLSYGAIKGPVGDEASEGGEDSPEGAENPSEDLVELVGTKQANALAEAGLQTIEAAAGYEGDLTELKGVGDATAADIADFAG